MAEGGHKALGMIETRGLVAALEAADAMLKASSVKLVGLEKTVPAMITIQITGETAAVQAAVDAGAEAAKRVGELITAHVIPHPSSDVAVMQLGKSGDDRNGSVKPEILENMTVRELRAFARTRSGLRIQGREIARANKQELLEALSSGS